MKVLIDIVDSQIHVRAFLQGFIDEAGKADPAVGINGQVGVLEFNILSRLSVQKHPKAEIGIQLPGSTSPHLVQQYQNSPSSVSLAALMISY